MDGATSGETDMSKRKGKKEAEFSTNYKDESIEIHPGYLMTFVFWLPAAGIGLYNQELLLTGVMTIGTIGITLFIKHLDDKGRYT